MAYFIFNFKVFNIVAFADARVEDTSARQRVHTGNLNNLREYKHFERVKL